MQFIKTELLISNFAIFFPVQFTTKKHFDDFLLITLKLSTIGNPFYNMLMGSAENKAY